MKLNKLKKKNNLYLICYCLLTNKSISFVCAQHSFIINLKLTSCCQSGLSPHQKPGEPNLPILFFCSVGNILMSNFKLMVWIKQNHFNLLAIIPEPHCKHIKVWAAATSDAVVECAPHKKMQQQEISALVWAVMNETNNKIHIKQTLKHTGFIWGPEFCQGCD